MGAVFARQGVRSFLMTDGDGQWRGRLYRFVWKCKSLIMECFDKVNVADIADVFDRASGFWVLGWARAYVDHSYAPRHFYSDDLLQLVKFSHCASMSWKHPKSASRARSAKASDQVSPPYT
jgi:hypothetical protein